MVDNFGVLNCRKERTDVVKMTKRCRKDVGKKMTKRCRKRLKKKDIEKKIRKKDVEKEQM